MTRWGFVIDISKCNACYCCFTACKDEYWDNDYPPYTAAQPKYGQFWMNLAKNERGKYPNIKVAYMPVPCMQCEDAPCIKAAKDGAVYKRPDGIVVIDPQKAVGQKQLVKSCPYGAIFWNEEKNLPQKCTFCVHRLEEGEIPRCVQACPSNCITCGDLDDPKSDVSKLLKSAQAETFHPEWNTKPSVYYIGLHRMTKHFIAGAVIYGDTDECAEDVSVTLTANGRSAKTKTNNYGDFEFDGLEIGKYTVKLECGGYTSKTIDVDLKTDTHLGDIILAKA
jgi:Fe-S-cluster-containing dehydrogenase component